MARVDKSMAVYGDWETEAALVAQRLLNAAIRAGTIAVPALTEDGKFGDKTLAAVRAFQKAKRLSQDDVVGPDTFRELGLVKEIQHPVKLRGQKTKMGCWSGASAMLNAGVAPPIATAQLNADGSLVSTNANVQAYANDANCIYRQAPQSAQRLLASLLAAPLWIGGTVQGHSSGAQLHVVIVGGVYSYRYNGAVEVVFKVYDPWPVGRGTIYFAKGSKIELEDSGVYTPHWFLEPRNFKP
ncbi:MAG: peptidoglycan-binding protein [Methylobacteriaceae bacterium]|nr:peptidoglycan-binding protein [Methylobacteriaceae bacterium]